MARVLVIENGDDWRAIDVPTDWHEDDIDRYLNGMAYGRAAVLTVESAPIDAYTEYDPFVPSRPGEMYGGGV